MYILCQQCGQKISVTAGGDYVCPACSSVETAKINEFYSNIYPVAWFVHLSYAVVAVTILRLIFGFYEHVESVIFLSSSVITFLLAAEGFWVGTARTYIGVLYKKESPVMVYSSSLLMLFISFLLLLRI